MEVLQGIFSYYFHSLNIVEKLGAQLLSYLATEFVVFVLGPFPKPKGLAVSYLLAYPLC